MAASYGLYPHPPLSFCQSPPPICPFGVEYMEWFTYALPNNFTLMHSGCAEITHSVLH